VIVLTSSFPPTSGTMSRPHRQYQTINTADDPMRRRDDPMRRIDNPTSRRDDPMGRRDDPMRRRSQFTEKEGFILKKH
jgi:hypothetical protein